MAENGCFLEGFPSGQRDQTVNLTALPSKVRILPPPPSQLVSGKNVWPSEVVYFASDGKGYSLWLLRV